MTGVIAYASLRHYFDHLQPVCEALQNATAPILRGVEAPPGRPWGRPLRRDRDGALWLVASYADARRVAPAPVIYLEHGAGQSYHGDPNAARSGSYAGGEGLEHVALFLCPHETVAQRWRARYRAPAVVVGAPKLDRWHQFLAAPQKPEGNVTPAPYNGGTVAVTWHWPNSICPEAQWALPHYRPALAGLARDMSRAGVELIGTGHPRAWRQLRREWARLGVEPVEHFDQVLERADLLAVDNSSAGPEFASTGRPIVWLSAPWYRRQVDHGGRFWTWVADLPHVEEPDQLAPTVLEVLAAPGRDLDAREAMVASVYAHRDGQAATRAAAAITEVCQAWRIPSRHG